MKAVYVLKGIPDYVDSGILREGIVVDGRFEFVALHYNGRASGKIPSLSQES